MQKNFEDYKRLTETKGDLINDCMQSNQWLFEVCCTGEAENYEFGDQSVSDYSTSGQQMFEINQSSFALPFKKS